MCSHVSFAFASSRYVRTSAVAVQIEFELPLARERDAQPSARRLVHATSGYELSRVRTEL